jgi:AAA family ATP:ADP antiporter
MEMNARKGRIERFLSVFTEVRAGEAGTALLLTLNVFLILCAYYFVKPAREALILAGSGAEVKSYAAAVQALLFLGVVPLYARLASGLDRRTLITRVTLFFVACLVAFAGLDAAGVSVGIPFFLWAGIFNLMIVAQFWSFANDVYSQEEGVRLFPLLVFGMSAGAVGGSFLAGRAVGALGVVGLLIVAALLLLCGLAVTWAVDRRQRAVSSRKVAVPEQARHVGEPEGGRLGRGGAFQLVWRSRYLLLVALMILLLNWVNTNGEYVLGRTVTESVPEGVQDPKAFIAGFYADFFLWVNLVGFAGQLFLVSRILRWLGVRGALFVHPLLSLIAYSTLAVFPVLPAVRWSKTAENATDYSLTNTVKNALFLPTSREEKYKAKQAIDGFFVRAGDVLSAAVVFAGTSWLALSTRGFALVNLVLVVVWLGTALLLARRHRQVAEDVPSEKGMS